jgi:hypothetical protein
MFGFGADGISEVNENQNESLSANGDQNLDKIFKELHKTDGVVKNGYDNIDVLSVIDTESSNLTDKNSFLTFLLSQEGDVIKNILNNIEQIVRMDQVSIIINFLKDKIDLNKAKELRFKLGDLVLIKANQVKITTLRKRIKSSNQVNLICNDIYLLMVLLRKR